MVLSSIVGVDRSIRFDGSDACGMQAKAKNPDDMTTGIRLRENRISIAIAFVVYGYLDNFRLNVQLDKSRLSVNKSQ